MLKVELIFVQMAILFHLNKIVCDLFINCVIIFLLINHINIMVSIFMAFSDCCNFINVINLTNFHAIHRFSSIFNVSFKFSFKASFHELICYEIMSQSTVFMEEV
jgi:hypothetical protein